MKSPLFIYVHGFNSSPQSMKAQLFLRYMQSQGCGDQVEIPDLSHWPAEAMAQLKKLVEINADRPVILLGSSLGGYYSTWLTEHYSNVSTVLINPSVRPFELLPQYLGRNENLYSGESYMLTETHLEQLLALHCEKVARPEAYLLLTQTGDETLDYREAVEKFSESPQFIQPGGSHGFEQFETLIPSILAFAQGQIKLPPATPI
ncbi:YqiA/YcfP family alpha/beta fold hydrolase [uncultured Neptuniibacter sp.]|uniref:YqiA/YcfP family alpha/beta fold hydrolase n=1 Tax=uncultured Neptuniibacter sp. TaxID=502143 RepID=UPI0026208C13|nr:YqiA/YcfP family alpha/beta fold hydrolase [uncultured Neptuniibacter sp.]